MFSLIESEKCLGLGRFVQCRLLIKIQFGCLTFGFHVLFFACCCLICNIWNCRPHENRSPKHKQQKKKDLCIQAAFIQTLRCLSASQFPVLTVGGPKYTWNAHQRTPVLKWVCPKILKIQMIFIILYHHFPTAFLVYKSPCSIIVSTPWPNDTLARSTSLKSGTQALSRTWSIDPRKNYPITNDTIHCRLWPVHQGKDRTHASNPQELVNLVTNGGFRKWHPKTDGL